MPDGPAPTISITLSPSQVDEVVRAASGGHTPSVAALLGDGRALAEPADPRLSRSLLRGLSLLTGFNGDGRPRGIVEIADGLGMSPSTAHRYALTLVQLGLLERDPDTRKYRLAGASRQAQ